MSIFSTRFIQVNIIIALLLSTTEAFAAYRQIEISGLKGDLQNNVELSIESEQSIGITHTEFIHKLKKDIQAALQALGHYNAVIKTRTNHITDKEHRIIEVTKVIIDAGDEVNIRSVNLQLLGEAQSDPPFIKLLKMTTLSVGDTLHHGRYEQTKQYFIELAQDRGYFDAHFTKNTVSVNTQDNTADVELTFNSGSRYKIGKLLIQSDHFDEEFIRRWVPFKSGEYYETRLITEMTRQLQASEYFSKVRVQTLYSKSHDNLVPISIELSIAPSNKVGIGLGFATDTGLRSKISWKRPHHNDSGHALKLVTGVSQIRQETTLQYKIPKKVMPLTDYWQVDFGALNERTEDRAVQLRTFNIQHVRQTSNLWQESLFVRWEHEKFTAGDEFGTINLLLPGISWSRTRSKGGIKAIWGDQFSIQILGGNTDLFSDIDVLKTVLSFKWLRTLKPKHKIILSLNYGAISSDEFEMLPSTHRFYVGGDRSIRGFQYNSISPQNNEGELTGGRYKEVGSAEYDYQFLDNWSAALFIDTGRSFDHFDEAYHMGAGFGIRWHSPVGPLRLDLGFGISEEKIPYQLHLSIGPDL